MGFEVRHDPGTGTQTDVLSPVPITVDYPPKRYFNKQETEDGAIVIQRHANDNRPRKWIWADGYRDTTPGYTALWTLLTSLEVKDRLENTLSPLIEIRDTVSGMGGFSSFVTVKVINVDRELRNRGGPPTYDKTTMEFVIADATYDYF